MSIPNAPESAPPPPGGKDLAALGIHPIPIPIPFLQAGGPVNAYAVEDEDGGILLVDAGFGSEEATGALADGFRRLGRRLDEVGRIVITHGHIDHFGGAPFVGDHCRRPPAVLAHPADIPKISEEGARWHDLAPAYRAHLARLGASPEVVEAIEVEMERAFKGRRLCSVQPLTPGQRLRTRTLELEVLHMPGHTRGLVCLLDRGRGVLFSNDHLLERVSPNPLIELGPDGQDGFFRPLVAYLESLDRTRALEVEVVLPGHGPPFGNHRQAIDSLRLFYDRRQERLVGTLRGGPLTPFEIARGLFRQLRPGDLFLAISEVVANMELLEASGKVVREEREGVRRYRRAS